MPVTKTVKTYAPAVGMMSCVGISTKEYPVSFGNYFWLHEGPRIINMWAENLEVAAQRLKITELECTEFSDGKNTLAFVTDPRLPNAWLYSKLCVTGCGWGSRELCEACLEFAGLENDWHYCGCEKPDERPSISRMMSFYPKVSTYCCQRCKRTESINYGGPTEPPKLEIGNITIYSNDESN